MFSKPVREEYPAYYHNYIQLVPEEDVLIHLGEQIGKTSAFFLGLTDAQADFRYAEGKWSIKEVIGHLTETERIMGYRALRIARGDLTSLAGYDDEAYVKEGQFTTRTMIDLVEELKAVRMSTLALLKGLPEGAPKRKGYANNGEVSANAIAYIIAGHELHHLKIIEERYLG
ncbi:DinB family protein [Niallia nealsonii]|uniref:DinB family protein n=1 Tax=Niallia nealsonii TaxID=115979 RepID=A0A2N0Z2M5_9BACI|nr:DinB family protein [Niallia nealsonii]PKG23765.1 DinB family protein [Niallia nealsonii]